MREGRLLNTHKATNVFFLAHTKVIIIITLLQCRKVCFELIWLSLVSYARMCSFKLHSVAFDLFHPLQCGQQPASLSDPE